MRPYSADLRALFCRYLDEGMSARAAGRVVGCCQSNRNLSLIDAASPYPATDQAIRFCHSARAAERLAL
jgi:hypothetical protein